MILTLWYTHVPIHAIDINKATCCRVALNLVELEIISVAEVTVSALFLAVHTLARFATIQFNFGVVFAHHGFSESQTSPERIVRGVVDGLYPRAGFARHSQGRYPGVSQPVVIRAPLIPPHFFDRGILAVVSLAWKRKILHTSATNRDTAGPTSEVVTAIPDSVGQRKMSAFSTCGRGVSRQDGFYNDGAFGTNPHKIIYIPSIRIHYYMYDTSIYIIRSIPYVCIKDRHSYLDSCSKGSTVITHRQFDQ